MMGMVWAYEPEPTNYSDLVANINLNHADNVIPRNIAVSNKDEEAPLYLSPTESGAHSLVRCRPEYKSSVNVPCTQLDSCTFNGRGPDFIKCDTELFCQCFLHAKCV